MKLLYCTNSLSLYPILFGYAILNLFILIISASFVNLNSRQLMNLTEAQAYLYKRLKSSKYVINPYKNLNSSQICTGTSSGFSGSPNEYEKWRSIYSKCVYLNGNLEINHFDPFNSDKDKDAQLDSYDFSFLDDIREITGYIIIYRNRIKNLNLKSLQIVRGNNLFQNKYSIYIDSNVRLESLNFINLTEVEKGTVLIRDNPNLCHMDEVNWNDIVNEPNKVINGLSKIFIQNNGNNCKKCLSTCCSFNLSQSNFYEIAKQKCGCWNQKTCQKLNKVVCHDKCDGRRCFGTGIYECCHSNCLGGCTGPENKDCFACKKLRIYKTGECVDECPKIHIFDPLTNEMVVNPGGLYQYGVTCVKTCPAKLYIHDNQYCLPKCPNDTYQDEELFLDRNTGKTGMRRVCKRCTPEKCPKVCYIEKLDKKDSQELTVKHLKDLENCEVLNSNLLILQPDVDHVLASSNMTLPELTEQDLEVLKSIRIINGFVRIQSSRFTSLNFLRNLEVIHAHNLINSIYSIVVLGKSIKTLGLNKLKLIENGNVYMQTDSLCLTDTINWNVILANKNNSVTIKTGLDNQTCAINGFSCDPACKGCWSTGPKSCQFCKTYKLEDRCVEDCNGTQINKIYAYLADSDKRECKYCHTECKIGCIGQTEYDCFECKNYKLKLNETHTLCQEKCPDSHYADESKKECLACYKDCYQCTGPKETIGPNGCTSCSSALVDNDNNYTVIKCIEIDRYNCSDNFNYHTGVVPGNLDHHPLKEKKVCRKCNDECDNCFNEGTELGKACKSCKNFYSKSTRKCVSDCSINEFKSNKECLPCNAECKSDCYGSGLFECNECRGFKLVLKDVKRVNDYFMQISENVSKLDKDSTSLSDLAVSEKMEFNELIKDFNTYIDQAINLNDLDDSKIFCVKKCPSIMPYKTAEFFCTDDKKLINPLKQLYTNILIFTVTTVLIIFIIFIAILVIFRIKEKQRNKIRTDTEKRFFAVPSYNDDKNSGSAPIMCDLRLIQADELNLRNELGRGAFGIVYQGYYIPNGEKNKRIKVAIKVLNKCKSSSISEANQTKELMDEAMLMASVDHKYCLQLSALCMAEPVMIVTQLMPYGSVVTYLQRRKINLIKNPGIHTEKMLLLWAQQIAEGMSYLESRDIVHRDLAARNILIKSLDHIKITDFGLARIIESTDDGFYANENSLMPIKWLAIESIKQRLFTHKSDVWSYGVCLWEIFTFCAKPYAELTQKDLAISISKGTRLAKPQMASVEIYKILLTCWMENPAVRPSFQNLSDEFTKMYNEPKRYLSVKKVDLEKDFITINDTTSEISNKLLNDSNEEVFNDDNLADDKENEYITTNEIMNEYEDDDCIKEIRRIPTFNSRLLTDEGIDLDSFDLRSSVGDVTKTIPSLHNQTRLPSLSESGNYSGGVVTFIKKTNIDKKERPGNIKRQENNLLDFENFITQSSIDSDIKPDDTPSPREKIKNYKDKKYYNNNNNSNNGNNKFEKKLKNIFFQRLAPKRLDSQLSTGTASTYLSSGISSDGSRTPGINGDFEEEQKLIVNNNLLTPNFTLNSLTPSRSNSNSSNSTSSTYSNGNIYDLNNTNNKSDIVKFIKRNKQSNSNSDYLEPVTYNARDNLEYYDESKESETNNKSDKKLKPINNYYNDDVSKIWDQKINLIK